MQNVITAPEFEMGNTESSLRYFLKQKLPKNAKILDIGCNVGSLLINLHLRGYKNIYGADINRTAIKHSKTIYPKLKNRLFVSKENILPFKNNSFDTVLIFDVIEHIPNLEEYLSKQVRRVLKENGRLIFQTPNKLINIPWTIVCSSSPPKCKNVHCSLQTLPALKKKLKRAGFEEVIIEKFNINTKYNKKKILKHASSLGIIIFHLLIKMPLVAYPNFFGHCTKK